MNKKLTLSILTIFSILIMVGNQTNKGYTQDYYRTITPIIVNTILVADIDKGEGEIEQSYRQPKLLIENYYHKQMDNNEYSINFLTFIKKYAGDNDLRLNFCGETTLLNALDIMSAYKTNQLSGLNISQLTEKYLLDNNYEPVRANHNEIAFSPNGSMTSSSLYYFADIIAEDTELYHAVSVFHFLAFLHSITFAELANKIKESYSLETPQNKACYDVLLLADSLTING